MTYWGHLSKELQDDLGTQRENSFHGAFALQGSIHHRRGKTFKTVVVKFLGATGVRVLSSLRASKGWTNKHSQLAGFHGGVLPSIPELV